MGEAGMGAAAEGVAIMPAGTRLPELLLRRPLFRRLKLGGGVVPLSASACACGARASILSAGKHDFASASPLPALHSIGFRSNPEMTSLQVSGTHHTRALQRLLPGGSGLWVGGGLHHVKSNFGEFEGSGKHGGRVEGVEGKQEGGVGGSL
eukprot:scaffold853_cov21-Tisochrysis_lutea.AAC.4